MISIKAGESHVGGWSLDKYKGLGIVSLQLSMQRGNGDYQVWEPDLVAEIMNGVFRFARGEISSFSTAKPTRDRIPDDVKMFVWQRDGGRCVYPIGEGICGSQERLEFDHIIPISMGGSNTARNIQLLCEKHNRSKGSNIA